MSRIPSLTALTLENWGTMGIIDESAGVLRFFLLPPAHSHYIVISLGGWQGIWAALAGLGLACS